MTSLWKPIATVPKDGTKVVGGWFEWDDARPPISHVERKLAWDKSVDGLRRRGNDAIFTPTHWRRDSK